MSIAVPATPPLWLAFFEGQLESTRLVHAQDVQLAALAFARGAVGAGAGAAEQVVVVVSAAGATERFATSCEGRRSRATRRGWVHHGR